MLLEPQPQSKGALERIGGRALDRSQDQRGSKIRVLLAAALIIACTFALSIGAALIDDDAQKGRSDVKSIIESSNALAIENAEMQQRFARLQAEYDELVGETSRNWDPGTASKSR